MFVDFNTLPDNARIWIYQTDRTLTETDIPEIQNYLYAAISEWQSHGNELQGSYQFLNSRMVLIAINSDYNDASGCSIDTSTRWMKALSEKLSIDFFDRSQAFLSENEIKTFSIFEAKKYVLNGNIDADTVIFNNQITAKEQLTAGWKIKAADSYLKKYFILA